MTTQKLFTNVPERFHERSRAGRTMYGDPTRIPDYDMVFRVGVLHYVEMIVKPEELVIELAERARRNGWNDLDRANEVLAMVAKLRAWGGGEDGKGTNEAQWRCVDVWAERANTPTVEIQVRKGQRCSIEPLEDAALRVHAVVAQGNVLNLRTLEDEMAAHGFKGVARIKELRQELEAESNKHRTAEGTLASAQAWGLKGWSEYLSAPGKVVKVVDGKLVDETNTEAALRLLHRCMTHPDQEYRKGADGMLAALKDPGYGDLIPQDLALEQVAEIAKGKVLTAGQGAA